MLFGVGNCFFMIIPLVKKRHYPFGKEEAFLILGVWNAEGVYGFILLLDDHDEGLWRISLGGKMLLGEDSICDNTPMDDKLFLPHFQYILVAGLTKMSFPCASDIKFQLANVWSIGSDAWAPRSDDRTLDSKWLEADGGNGNGCPC